jgi:hypothetical protein
MTVMEVNTHKHRMVGKLRFGYSGFLLNSSSLDRVFVATMYTSDADNIMRYTDEVRAAYSEMPKMSDGSSQGRDSGTL